MTFQTLETALLKVREYRPMSIRQLRRHIEELGIKPLGARQRPQPYPPDTAAKVLAHLGLAEAEPANGRIVSIDELRAERSKAAKARRAK